MQKLIDLLDESGMHLKASISSFDIEFMNKWHNTAYEKNIFLTYNYNYFEGQEADELGIDEYCDSRGDVIMVASSVISPGLVKQCHRRNKVVGVWVSSD